MAAGVVVVGRRQAYSAGVADWGAPSMWVCRPCDTGRTCRGGRWVRGIVRIATVADDVAAHDTFRRLCDQVPNADVRRCADGVEVQKSVDLKLNQQWLRHIHAADHRNGYPIAWVVVPTYFHCLADLGVCPWRAAAAAGCRRADDAGIGVAVFRGDVVAVVVDVANVDCCVVADAAVDAVDAVADDDRWSRADQVPVGVRTLCWTAVADRGNVRWAPLLIRCFHWAENAVCDGGRCATRRYSQDHSDPLRFQAVVAPFSLLNNSHIGKRRLTRESQYARNEKEGANLS